MGSQEAMQIFTNGDADRIRKKAGIGIAVRDDRKKLAATRAIPTDFCGETTVAEALAIRSGLMFAIEKQWASTAILSECKPLVDRLNDDVEDESQLAAIIRDIKQL